MTSAPPTTVDTKPARIQTPAAPTRRSKTWSRTPSKRRYGIRALWGDTRGTAAIEFSIIALPFFLIIFGAFEVGINYMANRMLNNGTDQVARMIRTGQIRATTFTEAQFKQELWNEDRTRLTVLIDPGRIKREVATNVELGPALRAGQRYTLSVEGGWPSADGASVLPAFYRPLLVTDPLRTRPDTGLWRSNAPCVGTREALEITFDRPFARQLLSKDIQVTTKDGRIVGGMILVGASETSWSFTPEEAWTQNEVVVVASTDLEAVAGNNFRDLLDHSQTSEDIEVATYAFPITLNSCSR